MLIKRIQLGFLHVAVAMTLVPINSTLNRIMIKELALSATLVAIFASLPYLFSPIQVAIGSFSDKYPLFGRRRSPYIFLGLLLCVIGLGISPYVAFLLESNRTMGMLLSILTFGSWGMGYNFAAVSYFALASELSGAKGRSRTIATMFFMMILAIIITSIGLSRMLEPYTPEALYQAFWTVAGVALVLGLLGLINLEPRTNKSDVPDSANYTWSEMAGAITGNPQAKIFFVYLLILLAAILGQDILLEPYGAEAFGLTVDQTTRITSIWGVSFLLSLATAGALEGRVSKFTVSKIGAWGGMIAFPIIIVSGLMTSTSVFYVGVVLLGLATGLSTVSNLSLMLDMTTAANVGLFIGAWGMSNAFSRLTGNVLGGVVRDSVTQIAQSPATGYQVVFFIETLMLFVSLILLSKIDVTAFQQQAQSEELSFVERAALAGDV
jgi:BCD family chlorophyll transporter-like MFS transporter